MSILHAENFDGVVAPAIPSGWNVDPNYATETAVFRSSPNGLQIPSSAAFGSDFYATWGTADGSAGNITVSCYVNPGGTRGIFGGVTARGSASTLDSSMSSQYVCWLTSDPAWPSLTPRSQFTIGLIQSGSLTTLASWGSSTQGNFTSGAWFQVVLTCNGSSLSAQCIRDSDGEYLQSNMGFSATPATLTASDSTLSGSGYAGIISQINFAETITFDDWELDSLASVLWPYMRQYQVPYRPPNTQFWV